MTNSLHNNKSPNPATSAPGPDSVVSDVDARLEALADQLYNVDHVTGEIVTHPPPRPFPEPYTVAWWKAVKRVNGYSEYGQRMLEAEREQLRHDRIDLSVVAQGISPEPRKSRVPACKQKRGCRLRQGHVGICGKRLGPSVPTTGPLGALPIRRSVAAPQAAAARTSLVTPLPAYPHKTSESGAQKRPDFCPSATWSWDAHRNAAGAVTSVRKVLIPCGRWKCEPCRNARLQNELSPEIQANMAIAAKRGWTLKLLTLTFDGTEPAGFNTDDGARLRTLELQHFIQWLRRAHAGIEYLRVAESHKNGRIHLHLLIVMPYIPQRVIQARWGRRVDVRPVFARCPTCWQSADTDAKKKRARVMLRGGSYSCANGHSMNSDQARRRFSISAAWEIGKYLTKQSDIGRMSRSRNWIKAVPPMPEESDHVFSFGGSLASLSKGLGLDQRATAEKVAITAYQLDGGERCDHWGDGIEWVGLDRQSWIKARGAP